MILNVLNMSEDICLLCQSNNTEQLVLLPCRQCNHEGIENQKLIHKSCLREYLHERGYLYDHDDLMGCYLNDFNLLENYILLNSCRMPQCPYCNTNNIDVKVSVSWLATLYYFLVDYTTNIFTIVCTAFFIAYGCQIFLYSQPSDESIFHSEPLLYKVICIGLIGANGVLLNTGVKCIINNVSSIARQPPIFYKRAEINFSSRIISAETT